MATQIEQQVPLEDTVRRESAKAEVAKGLIIPFYSFKLWNDSRKNNRYGASFLDMVQVELFKSFAYVGLGIAIYEVASRHL